MCVGDARALSCSLTACGGGGAGGRGGGGQAQAIEIDRLRALLTLQADSTRGGLAAASATQTDRPAAADAGVQAHDDAPAKAEAALRAEVAGLREASERGAAALADARARGLEMSVELDAALARLEAASGEKRALSVRYARALENVNAQVAMLTDAVRGKAEAGAGPPAAAARVWDESPSAGGEREHREARFVPAGHASAPPRRHPVTDWSSELPGHGGDGGGARWRGDSPARRGGGAAGALSRDQRAAALEEDGGMHNHIGARAEAFEEEEGAWHDDRSRDHEGAWYDGRARVALAPDDDHVTRDADDGGMHNPIRGGDAGGGAYLDGPQAARGSAGASRRGAWREQAPGAEHEFDRRGERARDRHPRDSGASSAYAPRAAPRR